MHRLVDAPALLAGVEGVVDRAQLLLDDPYEPCLFGDLTQGRLGQGLALLDATLGQSPHRASRGPDETYLDPAVRADDDATSGCSFELARHAHQ